MLRVAGYSFQFCPFIFIVQHPLLLLLTHVVVTLLAVVNTQGGGVLTQPNTTSAPSLRGGGLPCVGQDLSVAFYYINFIFVLIFSILLNYPSFGSVGLLSPGRGRVQE
jgi:hypothetical protein